MKFRKLGRIALASVASVAAAMGMTACAPSNTIDFLYVTSSARNPGQIDAYLVDSMAGALEELPDGPYPSGGRNPVADATTPNGKYPYVINHDDNTVVDYATGTDGKLYPQRTCNLPGSYPMQLTVNPAGTFLYIVETYAPNYSTNVPGPGALVVMPIGVDGLLGVGGGTCIPVPNGENQFFPLGNNPVGVNVLKNGKYLYVVNENDATIAAYQITASGGVSPLGTYPVGVLPNALASDPTNRFMYVTDGASNQLVGFLIQTDGTLLVMQLPFATDQFPDAVTVEPRGYYLYVANYNSNDISSYDIDLSTGNATQTSGSGTYAVDTGPDCILVEPSEARYVYTTNYLGDTVSGVALNPDTGALSAVENSPFKAQPQPTCEAAITHGNHAISVVQPVP